MNLCVTIIDTTMLLIQVGYATLITELFVAVSEKNLDLPAEPTAPTVANGFLYVPQFYYTDKTGTEYQFVILRDISS